MFSVHFELACRSSYTHKAASVSILCVFRSFINFVAMVNWLGPPQCTAQQLIFSVNWHHRLFDFKVQPNQPISHVKKQKQAHESSHTRNYGQNSGVGEVEMSSCYNFSAVVPSFRPVFAFCLWLTLHKLNANNALTVANQMTASSNQRYSCHLYAVKGFTVCHMLVYIRWKIMHYFKYWPLNRMPALKNIRVDPPTSMMRSKLILLFSLIQKNSFPSLLLSYR